jgi:hypothetical protein
MNNSPQIAMVFAVAAALHAPECKSQSAVQHVVSPGRIVKVNLLQKEEGVEVAWITDSIHERTVYEIQRSANGIHFTTIGRVASSFANNAGYSYFDNEPPDANNVYYRLRKCNSSNECSYSPLKSIKINRQKPLKAYPVIPGNNIRVTYNALNAADVLMLVYNTYGNDIHRENREIAPGINDFTITLENLPRGYYVLKMVGGGINESVSFVK